MKNTSFQNLYLQSVLVSFTYLYGRVPVFIDGALWCIFPKKPTEFVHKIISMIKIKVTNGTFDLEYSPFKCNLDNTILAVS